MSVKGLHAGRSRSRRPVTSERRMPCQGSVGGFIRTQLAVRWPCRPLFMWICAPDYKGVMEATLSEKLQGGRDVFPNRVQRWSGAFRPVYPLLSGCRLQTALLSMSLYLLYVYLTCKSKMTYLRFCIHTAYVMSQTSLLTQPESCSFELQGSIITQPITASRAPLRRYTLCGFNGLNAEDNFPTGINIGRLLSSSSSFIQRP